LDMLSTLLTNLLGAIEGDEKLLIWFEECQASNPERRTTTFLAMRASGDIGQNEMRAEMGLPPDEDLNQAVIQASSMAGITQILTLLGQGSIQREQAVATFVGMGVPTDVAENIAGVGLPEPEPPAPPELPKPPAGEEDEPEEETPEEGEEDEAVEELKLANLLLAKAMEPPEQQADRLLKSVERSWTSQSEDKSEEEKYNLKHLSGEHNQLTHGHGGGGGTRLGGSPGGRESYNDRIEGTQAEANREVVRANKAVIKAKSEVRAAEQRLQGVSDANKSRIVSESRSKLKAIGSKIEQLKAKQEASKARIAALKAQLKKSKEDIEQQLEIELNNMEQITDGFKKVVEELKQVIVLVRSV